MDDRDRALEAHLFDRRHERRVEGLGLAPEFWGGCAVADTGHPLLELIRSAPLALLELTAIPGVDQLFARHSRYRVLAVSPDQACLARPEVRWRERSPSWVVIRRGRWLSHVVVAGHPLVIHTTCADALEALWAGSPSGTARA